MKKGCLSSGCRKGHPAFGEDIVSQYPGSNVELESMLFKFLKWSLLDPDLLLIFVVRVLFQSQVTWPL